MKLSEAILKGCQYRGSTYYHVIYDGRTDAWGAALEGAGWLDWDHWLSHFKEPFLVGRAIRTWPVLQTEIACPTCGRVKSVYGMFEHLFVNHGWSREAIAQWIGTLEGDLAVLAEERGRG